MIDLNAVRRRYSRALDAKPSKGAWEPEKIAWLCDSNADIPELLAEIQRLQREIADILLDVPR